jgi:Domain of unknown function (DUF4124)
MRFLDLACGAAAIVLAGHPLSCASAEPPAHHPVYRCTVAGVTTFSDQPCDPAATVYEPDPTRVSTYSPPPVRPLDAIAPRSKPSRDRLSAGTDQVRHAAECERIRAGLKEVLSRMRAGYSARQGEQLRERKAKLESRRRAAKCG